MRLLILGMGLVSLLLWGGCRTIEAKQFEWNCEEYLKRAADANTVELARDELLKALEYIEANRMTDGNTGIVWKTPKDDAGYWYKNLKAAYGELERITPETTQLERTNVLMKLRETILDEKGEGTYVTAPEGISVFPNNRAYAAWGGFSLLFSLLAGIAILSEDY